MAVEECKKNKNRVNVYMDGSFAFACYKDTAVEHRVGVGRQFTSGQVEDLRHSDGELYAFQTALSLVAAKQRSRKDIETKLRAKGVEEEFIQPAVEKLEGYGYLDDEEYARAYAEELVLKYGRKLVRMKLVQKGIDNSVAERVVNELDDSEALKSLLSRVEARYAGEPEQKRRQKIIRAMLQKGFEYDDIQGMMGQGYEE